MLDHVSGEPWLALQLCRDGVECVEQEVGIQLGTEAVESRCGEIPFHALHLELCRDVPLLVAVGYDQAVHQQAPEHVVPCCFKGGRADDVPPRPIAMLCGFGCLLVSVHDSEDEPDTQMGCQTQKTQHWEA